MKRGGLGAGGEAKRASLSGLLIGHAVDPLPVLQGEASLLGVAAAVQDGVDEAVLGGRQGGRLARQDAAPQPLAVPRVGGEGRRRRRRRQPAAAVHLHGVALAVDAGLGLGRGRVRGVALVGPPAVLLTVVLPPVVPQVEDMTPGGGGGQTGETADTSELQVIQSWMYSKNWRPHWQYGGVPSLCLWSLQVLQPKPLCSPKSIFPADCNTKTNA